MTSETSDSGSLPTPTTTAERIALVDRVIGLPFPQGEEAEDSGVRSSGPSHHLLILRASEDFWDGRQEETAEPAEEEIEAEFSAVATALTERWGEPETVDLWPWLAGGDETETEMASAAPEPLGQLCNLAGSMQVWRIPGTTRWLGLTVGQADPEFPIWLLAAVGEAEVLESGLPGEGDSEDDDAAEL
ncbi:hypothetical protein [Streptomyces sp. NBC_00102]|uniref:hypothetical protein n=1 Tax=Streptomyces sp. NBC_00102 TaxID=2975652 RepID=UPI002259AFCA|nr:hypothetical protein [Streptomyces sp. NBC_00102]MCX5398595.1 hypothetical protein [Streptomyces sp. NBC_00102]